MHGNNVIKKGNSTAGNGQAKKLIKATGATSSSLDTTIEFDLQIDGVKPDIFLKAGKYGDTVYVRSKFSYTRFFPVLYKEGEWRCTCGDPNCMHVKRAIQFLACEKELVFK